MMASPEPHQVTCFGEVLWDILPSAELPGGAPMNVAYHLRKLGINPALITRIGRDEYGTRLKAMLEASGLTTDYLQVDEDHNTGLVYARPGAYHEVTYDIVFPSAWDFIQWKEEFGGLLQQASCFIYGSLASRHEVSRDTLHRLLETARTRVLDINLRPPHFDRAGIEYLLQKAGILKMNSAELELVAGWYGQYDQLEDRVLLLQERFGIDTLIVTMGAEGALVREGGTIYRHPGFAVQVADTIGSGDAFLAGFIHQKLQGAPADIALEAACGMGAFVATRAGACPSYEKAEVTALIQGKATAG